MVNRLMTAFTVWASKNILYMNKIKKVINTKNEYRGECGHQREQTICNLAPNTVLTKKRLHITRKFNA
ncbi:hypothetical protein ABE47_03065 [Bacillus thuringiensis]|nr:hypothetical protein [Bacillus thuringiensis]MBG9503684.1 hypothetical protein [Bacillus thuringiensis]MBG9510431.1 hypothetical protein [Bacillus thuringiensis]MBG9511209.1 hypothetical protein [Bacillus thuringiensis]PDY32259.1 hypothetical protein COM85_30140 [Bacillus thuringiensis]